MTLRISIGAWDEQRHNFGKESQIGDERRSKPVPCDSGRIDPNILLCVHSGSYPSDDRRSGMNACDALRWRHQLSSKRLCARFELRGRRVVSRRSIEASKGRVHFRCWGLPERWPPLRGIQETVLLFLIYGFVRLVTKPGYLVTTASSSLRSRPSLEAEISS